MKIIIVAGARPNFMKIAPIIRQLKVESEKLKVLSQKANDYRLMTIDYLLVHTGQHYDYEMSQVFFEDLEIPEPDIYLDVGSGTHAEQSAKVMIEFEKVLMAQKPDIVIVVGDVNSTLACALATSKIDYQNGNSRTLISKGEEGDYGSKKSDICHLASDFCGRRPLIAHVEAGLRSFDRSMPEEINRILTDQISDFLFVSEPSGLKNLKREGIPDDKIYFVGNVMIDTLLRYKTKAEGLGVARRLLKADKPYAVLTLHRPSNVDHKETLFAITEGLREISRDISIIFPVHPRVKINIDKFGLSTFYNFNGSCSANIHCVDPLGFLEFLNLNMNARFVMTDSGGIQEETTVLGIPCFTLRDTTERPVTITEGTNRLINAENLVSKIKAILDSYKPKSVNSMLYAHSSTNKKVPQLWDGRAAERIVEILVEYYKV